MKRMRRITDKIFVLLLGWLFVAGCSGGGEAPANTEAEKTKRMQEATNAALKKQKLTTGGAKDKKLGGLTGFAAAAANLDTKKTGKKRKTKDKESEGPKLTGFAAAAAYEAKRTGKKPKTIKSGSAKEGSGNFMSFAAGKGGKKNKKKRKRKSNKKRSRKNTRKNTRNERNKR